jgi:hypothetical protein
MAGFTTNEGLNYIGNVLYKGGTQETLILGLFTNPAPPTAPALDETAVWADINQPTGTGYAEITLTQGNFSVSASGVVQYPQQTWTATANDWVPNGIFGYYIRNDNATPKLLHVQYRDEGVFFMLDGQIYTVDLSIDTS